MHFQKVIKFLNSRLITITVRFLQTFLFSHSDILKDHGINLIGNSVLSDWLMLSTSAYINRYRDKGRGVWRWGGEVIRENPQSNDWVVGRCQKRKSEGDTRSQIILLHFV